MDWIRQTLQTNGTLKNKFNIKDSEALQELEFRLTQYKYRSIPTSKITDINDLKRIHRWLFSDLYDWAGEYRPGDFGKGTTEFFPRSRFESAIKNLNQQIQHINQTSYQSDLVFATDLGKLMFDINVFHPFREGNGRAQRLFIQQLAKQNGKDLHIRKSDPAYPTYMNATINDDYHLMAQAILKAIK
ncbi:MAG: Fic family protein [Lentilactobacillus diolivorans]|jgi:cell filamentation protein|nr:Fic family protein [Lentilactobacillus diolivorans]RRG03173.1 MAG: cell division protein [Lactobacillus sp.]